MNNQHRSQDEGQPQKTAFVPVITPRRPGQGSWGWRQALAGILVAALPVTVLNLLALVSGAGGEAVSGNPTTTEAIAGVIATLVLDSWFVFSAWLFSLRGSDQGIAAWGISPPRARVLWVVPAALGAVFALNLIYSLFVTSQEQDVVSQFPHNASGLLLFILLACVIAPLFEEIFFRGFLFQAFARSWGVPAGAVISAALFALSHLQLDVAVPLFVLGLGLAFVFVVTRSLWASIALHAAFNAIAVVVWAFD